MMTVGHIPAHRSDFDRAGSAGFQPARGGEVPLTTRSVAAWASPTSRLEAGAPSAIVVVPTRFAVPTSRLEAGAPSAFRGRGRPVAPGGEAVAYLVEVC